MTESVFMSMWQKNNTFRARAKQIGEAMFSYFWGIK
jgi:hypothetical protein